MDFDLEKHNLLFGVRRSIRYHARRRSFFDRYDLFTNAVAVIFGSATIYAVFSSINKEWAVAAAAVIGVKHPKWQERPLLFVVRKQGWSLEREEILEFLANQVARLCVPDEVIFLESLPVGGTGKVQKAVLRENYGHVFGWPKEVDI